MATELTQKDKKIAELLSEAGLKRNTAKILVYLRKAGEAESSHVESATGLRQPEVSLAMKELEEWGWAKEREVKKKGKGRPIKSYKLAIDLKHIVHEIINKKLIEEEMDRQTVILTLKRRLKDLTGKTYQVKRTGNLSTLEEIEVKTQEL